MWLWDIDNYKFDEQFCVPGHLNVLDFYTLYSTNIVL